MRFLGEREFSSQTQCLVLGSIKKKGNKTDEQEEEE